MNTEKIIVYAIIAYSLYILLTSSNSENFYFSVDPKEPKNSQLNNSSSDVKKLTDKDYKNMKISKFVTTISDNANSIKDSLVTFKNTLNKNKDKIDALLTFNGYADEGSVSKYFAKTIKDDFNKLQSSLAALGIK